MYFVERRLLCWGSFGNEYRCCLSVRVVVVAVSLFSSLVTSPPLFLFPCSLVHSAHTLSKALHLFRHFPTSYKCSVSMACLILSRTTTNPCPCCGTFFALNLLCGFSLDEGFRCSFRNSRSICFARILVNILITICPPPLEKRRRTWTD